MIGRWSLFFLFLISIGCVAMFVTYVLFPQDRLNQYFCSAVLGISMAAATADFWFDFLRIGGGR